MNRHDNFTLLELIFVLALIAATMAMAAPSLRGFFRSRESFEAAERVVNLARTASRRALAESTMYRLNYDLSEGRFWLSRAIPQDQGSGWVFEPVPGLGTTLPDGARAVWEQPAASEVAGGIVFFPDGRSSPLSLRLVDQRGEHTRIVGAIADRSFRVIRGE